MVTVALDPGKTTGIAILVNEEEDPVIGHLYNLEEVGMELETWKPDIIIYESFQLRHHRRAVSLEPVEVIGAIKYLAAINSIPLFAQTAAQGKKFWTNEKLNELTYYMPGYPHGMDALRHLLYYKTFTERSNYWLQKLNPDNADGANK